MLDKLYSRCYINIDALMAQINVSEDNRQMTITVLDRCTVTTGDVSLEPIERFGEVRYFDTLPQEELASAIGDSDCVICNKAKITSDVMDACPHLRYIGLFATGYNNIDVRAAASRGIAVCNAPGYSTESVAQLVFAMILGFATSLGNYSTSTARGDWTKSGAFSYLAYPITELYGKTLGIFGFGTIGRAVSRIGLAFGMDVVAVAHRETVYDGVRFVNTDELFRCSDYLTLHCPLTDETRGTVNRRTLSMMKPSAVLINTSRGAVVEESALASALRDGRIRGAGIDVLDTEPMLPGHPYLGLENCVITPHVAWASIEARRRLIGIVTENLADYLRGGVLNRVDISFR